MVASLYCSKKFLTPNAMLYLYKSQIQWSNVLTSEKVHRNSSPRAEPLQSLFRRRNVASLSLACRYIHEKCSDGLHSLVPPLREFHVALVLPGQSLPILTASNLHKLDVDFMGSYSPSAPPLRLNETILFSFLNISTLTIKLFPRIIFS